MKSVESEHIERMVWVVGAPFLALGSLERALAESQQKKKAFERSDFEKEKGLRWASCSEKVGRPVAAR